MRALCAPPALVTASGSSTCRLDATITQFLRVSVAHGEQLLPRLWMELGRHLKNAQGGSGVMGAEETRIGP